MGDLILKRRIVIAVLIGFVALAVFYCIDLATVQRDHFVDRPGKVQDYRLVRSTPYGETGIIDTLRLHSSSGLSVDMRVLRPADAVEEPLPLVVMLGGHRTGKDAVELVGEPRGIAYAAIDYPYRGQHSLDGMWEIVTTIPDLQGAFLDTPPALSLALEWLLTQPWVDPDRVELAGISLGVPFAAIAGAVDDRFTRVWLIHGGGDNFAWIMHAARKRIANESLRGAMARGALFISYGNSFDTAAWIGEIAPRPLVIIAARDDDRVPYAAQAPFVEAAESDSVELIWTEGLHIGPNRQHELQQLLEIVLGRIDTQD